MQTSVIVSLALTCAAALAPTAAAQSFNLDVGLANAVPTATFGAAAAQPGTWNSVSRTTGATPISLLDLAGAPTSVTFARTAGGGTDFSFNNAGTSGDDELLLDDAEFPTSSTGSTWTIAGLAAGTYDVYTYAWAPDSAAFITGVSVNGGPLTLVGGTWAGAYAIGVTHAKDTVVVTGGGSIAITLSVGTSFATFNGVQIVKVGTPTTSYCFGDGTGTACPCANNGAAGNGCGNSLNPNGAQLSASGTASATLANDTWLLSGTGIPNGPGLYFQGTTQLNGGLGVVFGDGLRCVGGTVIRLGIVAGVSNASTYPSGATPPNNIPISQKGLIAAGDVRNYQLWYRDSAAFCTASVFNLTNAVNVTWAP